MKKIFAFFAIFISVNAFCISTKDVDWKKSDKWQPVFNNIVMQDLAKAIKSLSDIRKDLEPKANDYKRSIILEVQIYNKQELYKNSYELLKKENLLKTYSPILSLYYIETLKSFLKQDKNISREFIQKKIQEIRSLYSFLYFEYESQFNKSSSILFHDFIAEIELKEESFFEHLSVSYIQFLDNLEFWSEKEQYTIELYSFSHLNSLDISKVNALAFENLHPYERILFLYKGIENFYWKRDNLDQHVEGHIERTQFLARFANEKELLALDYELKVFLRDRYMSSVWPMGMLVRANLIQKINSEKAIDILDECVKAVLETRAHKECLKLKEKLIAPRLSIKGDQYYPPGEQKFILTTKNVENVYFQILKIDESLIQKKTFDIGSVPGLMSLAEKSELVFSSKQHIENRTSTSIVTKLKSAGMYIVNFSNKKMNQKEKVLGDSSFVFEISEIGYLLKKAPFGFYIYVYDTQTGIFLENAKVTFNKQSVLTDNKGMAYIKDNSLKQLKITHKKRQFLSLSKKIITNNLLIENQKLLKKPIFRFFLSSNGEFSLSLFTLEKNKLKTLSKESFSLKAVNAKDEALFTKKYTSDDFGMTFGDLKLSSSKLSDVQKIVLTLNNIEYVIHGKVDIREKGREFEFTKFLENKIEGKINCEGCEIFYKFAYIQEENGKVPKEKLVEFKRVNLTDGNKFEIILDNISHTENQKIEIYLFQNSRLMAKKVRFFASKKKKIEIHPIDDFIFKSGSFKIVHNLSETFLKKNNEVEVKIYSLKKEKDLKVRGEIHNFMTSYDEREEWARATVVKSFYLKLKKEHLNSFKIKDLPAGHYQIEARVKDSDLLANYTTSIMNKKLNLGLNLFLNYNQKGKVYLDRPDRTGSVIFNIWENNKKMDSLKAESFPTILNTSKYPLQDGRSFSALSYSNHKMFVAKVFPTISHSKIKVFFDKEINDNKTNHLDLNFTVFEQKNKKLMPLNKFKYQIIVKSFLFGNYLKLSNEFKHNQERNFNPFIHMPNSPYIVRVKAPDIAANITWFSHSHISFLNSIIDSDWDIPRMRKNTQGIELKDFGHLIYRHSEVVVDANEFDVTIPIPLDERDIEVIVYISTENGDVKEFYRTF